MAFIATNPTTEEVLAEIPSWEAPQIDAALETASRAAKVWRATSLERRAELLVRAAELLESEIPVVAELMTSEMGKTFASAKGEAAKCAQTMRYFAAEGPAMMAPITVSTSARRSGVRFEPLGVIFAVMPWNFPLWQVVRMAIPALTAGNVVAFKHAPNVPGSASYLEDLFRRAGFPAGVLTNFFVEVDDVAAIIADSRVAGVSLTGSEKAGRSVGELAGRHLKPCVLELGGSDPFLIAESADLELTVAHAVTARVQNNGQACIAAKRFIVVRQRADEFIARFSEEMAAVPTGDPMDPSTILGPLVSHSQRELLDAQVRDALAKGANALTGGTPIESKGYYYPATVLTHVPETSRAHREELFGPVATVYVVDDLEEGIRWANDTPWGLGASVWASDDAEIDRAIAELDTGMVFANAVVASTPELPFGGTKRSGVGRELSLFGVREFTNVKSYFVS